MTPQQVLMLANSLLQQFCLQIRAGEQPYRLGDQNDLTSLVAHANKSGKIYWDGRNLLNQTVRQKEAEGLFLDDETKAKRAKKQLDATRLDVGTQTDEE